MVFLTCTRAFLVGMVAATGYATCGMCLPTTPNAITPVHQFGLGHWVENLYVRPQGQILVSIFLPSAQLYQIDPQTRNAYLAANDSKITSLLGIQPTSEPDVYYVIGEDVVSRTITGVRGSDAIYRVDLRSFNPPHSPQPIEMQLALRVPNAIALNGLQALDVERDLYLATDLNAGSIYLLNMTAAQADVILHDELTSTLNGTFGANGIKIQGNYIYWTNTDAALLARVPIDELGTPSGPVEEVVGHLEGVDDFTFDAADNAFFASGGGEILMNPRGCNITHVLVSGLHGPTACRFGRTPTDKDSLYVTVSGGDAAYTNNTQVYPGGLVRVNLASEEV